MESWRSRPGWTADIGVPDLVDPVYGRALILDVGLRNSDATADIEVPGMQPYRVQLQGGASPGSFGGLVPGWGAPVLVDATDTERTILLEPPCGPDLPLVSDDLQQVRDARDLRTSALAEKYPPPSAAQIEERLRSTASAVHPYWDAVCWRIGLLTTAEARAVIDRIRSDGNSWDAAEAELYSCGQSIPNDLRTRIGECVSHLRDVAPAISSADVQLLWTFGVAALMHDLKRDEVDDDVYERVMHPFVEVCGPLPEERSGL